MKDKKEVKQVGLWLDHALALIADPAKCEIRKIHSGHSCRVRIPGETADGVQLGNHRATNNEAHKHAAEENAIRYYYGQLAEELLPYDEILIFGPTTAPDELHHYLRHEKNFQDKKMIVRKTDYFSESQVKSAVRKFFALHVGV